jgi:hypothetical protein
MATTERTPGSSTVSGRPWARRLSQTSLRATPLAPLGAGVPAVPGTAASSPRDRTDGWTGGLTRLRMGSENRDL